MRAKKAVKSKKTFPAAAKKKTVVQQPAPVKSLSPIKTPYNKSQLLKHLSAMTMVEKKRVVSAVDHLGALIEGHLKKGSIGEFTLPGLAKFKVIRKPALPARKGVNPFTGLETMFKAKPSRTVVKIRPLKKLKEAVN